MTNREKLESMTNKEFAVFLNEISGACWFEKCVTCPMRKCFEFFSCTDDGIAEWLESEVADD